MKEHDYKNIYDKPTMNKCSGHIQLSNGHLRFGDALSAIGYAHGIDYDVLTKRFPEVGKNNRYAGNDYTFQDQLEFIQQNTMREPKKILEIGGGRGEVATMLDRLGRDVTSIEPGKACRDLYEESRKILTPDWEVRYNLINESIHKLDLDYSEYDTIMMVESLEHILERDFEPQWQKMLANFSGRFVAVNWIEFHPIAVGQYAPAHVHCRRTDDKLYNRMVAEAGTQWTRRGSHIVIDFNKK